VEPGDGREGGPNPENVNSSRCNLGMEGKGAPTPKG